MIYLSGHHHRPPLFVFIKWIGTEGVGRQYHPSQTLPSVAIPALC